MHPLEILALYLGTFCGVGFVTLGIVWIWEKRF